MPTLLPVGRSCEKHGCNEPGEVAFGIDRIACVVWLEAYDPDEMRHLNRLCDEHAARLTLPRSWSFDDRREKSPRLFARPRTPLRVIPAAKTNTTSTTKPARKPAPKTSPAPRRTSRDTTSPAKRFSGPGLFDPTLPMNSPLLNVPLSPAATPMNQADDSAEDAAIDATVDSQPVYAPKFDRTSDVGGTLNATGRLLKRAFSSQTKPIERPPQRHDTDSLPQGDHLDDFNQGDHVE